jgi:O-antigen ligase/Tfp pilus assembly protein PilF
MFERLGIRDRRELVVWLGLVLLVALTPAGKESTQPLILALYRTLLLGLILAYISWTDRSKLRRLSPLFMGAVAVLMGVMAMSVWFWDGSSFEGWYVFYENILFIAAFIVLAHGNAGRPAQWKFGILAAVVLIDVAYIAGTLFIGKRPLLGPFVNPNYLGSFVLPGIAVCAAVVFLSSSIRLRLAAGVTGLFLYYGVGQTASRGATLAGLALLGLGAFRAARRRGISLAYMGVAAALLIIITVSFNPALVSKFLDRGEGDPYNYQRGQIWLGTLRMIGDHPIAGSGLGYFAYISKLYTPAVETTIGHYRRYANIAHSEYLQYAAEIGIPGALLLFALGTGLLLLAWRRAEHPSTHAVVQESAILAATGLCVHALVDNNWTVPVMAGGLAVISQADLLPYTGSPMPRAQLSSMLKHALVLLFLGVWIDSALVPAIAFHFNEAGHDAHVADNFEQAERHHRYALAVLPTHPVLLDNLGIVYLDQFMKTHESDYLDRAELLFKQSMAANPHFDVPAGHLESTLVQRLTGDPEKDRNIHKKIIAADLQALAANPFNPFIRKNLAEAYYNIGDRNQACEELLKAIEIEPNYVPAYLRLAAWYDEAGMRTESEKYRSKAIQVANFYKDQKLLDPFDSLLLGRPQPPKQP